jgi:hypothetical protein
VPSHFKRSLTEAALSKPSIPKPTVLGYSYPSLILKTYFLGIYINTKYSSLSRSCKQSLPAGLFNIMCTYTYFSIPEIIGGDTKIKTRRILQGKGYTLILIYPRIKCSFAVIGEE